MARWWPFGRKARKARQAREREMGTAVPVPARVAGQEGAPAGGDDTAVTAESATATTPAEGDNAEVAAETATGALPVEHAAAAPAAESATVTMSAGGDHAAETATAAMDVALDALEAALGDAAAVRRALPAHAALLVTPEALDRARARVEAARTAADQEREARAVAVLGMVTGVQGMAADEVASADAQDEPTAEEEMRAAAEARESTGNESRGELSDVPAEVRTILAQLETLTRLEDMPARIALLDQALALVTREDNGNLWAALQVNLGNALAQNRLGDRRVQLERAIACYDAAFLEYRREVAPVNWATTQNNKGNALADLAGLLGGEERQWKRQDAIACYDNALLEFLRAVTPTDHREIAQYAGLWLFAEEEWAEAARFLGMALDVLDDLFTLAVTARGREAELEAGGELTAHLAYALARADEPGAALAAARALERGRARATGAAVRRRRDEIAAAEARVAPELLAAFRAAAARLAAFTLDDGRAALDASGAEGGLGAADVGGGGAGAGVLAATAAPGDRYEQAKQARADYDAAVVRIRERVPGFLVPRDPLPAAARALRPDERLGYMASTPAGSVLALVGVPAEGMQEPAAEAWWDEGLTRGLVVDLLERREGQGDQRRIVGGLFHAQHGIGSLRDALEEAMGALGMPGGVLAELAARCRARHVARVVLVPGGLLGLLPLHAALVPHASAGAEPEPLQDRVRVSYAPSAAVWLACRERAVAFPRTTPRALVVGDSLPQPAAQRLPGAEEQARKVFAVVERDAGGQAQLIETDNATRKTVLAALCELAPDLTHAHFACHGEVNITHPLDSGLLMANGARLMVRDLVGGDVPYLARLRLAGLSACQTALQGTRLPDEAVGLPAGWLRAGAIGVLGSLWPISDDATVVLMTRFYELHLLDGLEPGDALWLAQRWLRGLPSWREDFRAAGAVELAEGPEASDEVRGLRLARGEALPDDDLAEAHVGNESGRRLPPRVWDDPLHWAAFALYGS